jgi:cytochrome c-type biogenesis protein CcmF
VNTGSISIITAFFAMLVSTLLYGLSLRLNDNKSTQEDTYIKAARLSYYVMTFFVALASVYLLYGLLTHNFQFRYIYQYSSRDLPLGYLVSAFWAGQEGSFLFWGFLTAVLGLVLVRTAGIFERPAMFFLGIIQGLFLLLLIKASPFALMPRMMADGAGLNPLLQNPWMVIHPPILFIGYAASTFVVVLAFAGLYLKKYDEWVSFAFPWAGFTSLTLGAGIIIGAFWAYEVLGWGGYWGWDPVENSSLIPWLITLALLHGLIIQKRNGALKKMNFVLAALSFLLVIYATFLTRSGVLEDFSVHSFQDLGINVYLIIFMVSVLIIAVALFALRFASINGPGIEFNNLNRENTIILSMFVFSASALLTFLGTSSPIISGIFGEASQVDISFYNKVNLPVGILLGLLVGISPLAFWAEKGFNELLKRLLVPAVSGLIAMSAGFYFGISSVLMLLFLFTAGMALATNTIVIVQQAKINWMNTGAPMAHFGLSIVLIGIIVSGNFDTTERVVLPNGQVRQVFGYQMTYNRFVTSPDGKHYAEITVNNDGHEYLATPRFYQIRNGEMMREPDVTPGVITDLYISPLQRMAAAPQAKPAQLLLKKGEEKEFSGYRIAFTGFQMGTHEGSNGFLVNSALIVSNGSEKWEVAPGLIMGPNGRQEIPVEIRPKNGKSFTIHMASLDADEGQIGLSMSGLEASPMANQPAEQLLVEVSKKPFMSILWVGSIILSLGTLIGLRKRMTMVHAG